MHELQAAAAVGQMGLVQVYESCFRGHGLHTAQVLLTHADLADRQRYLNARSTLLTLLSLGIIPVINENDTVVTEEIRFGDNDTLGALVTNLSRPTCWSSSPTRKASTPAIRARPRRDPRARSERGRPAARGNGRWRRLRDRSWRHADEGARCEARGALGAQTVIASGRGRRRARRIAAGEEIGTSFQAQTTPLAARKQWLADHVQVAGRLQLDAGARGPCSPAARACCPSA